MELNSVVSSAYITKRNISETKKELQNNSEITQPKDLAPLPSTKQYLAFTGGYSLNLAETIQNLDKLAQKNSDIYPQNIREWAGMILEGGNKAKQTLIDVHKRYYESLKDCKSLAEAKEKFNEFKNVLSDKDVSFSKNSFGYNVKEGLMDAFDKDEDLSLQLLKLYYGEGFSLNDLKAYAGDTDLFHTMKKLQIPTVSRDYGHILKFSDPQYNDRLTKEMTYRRRLALDAKAQEVGEPVHIPRGALSKEHREHISEGLRKFYANNPERIFDMSEKQKMFYQDNPEKAEEFSRVMKKAWSVFGADRIKSAMSKYMKQYGIKAFDPEVNPVQIPKEQSRLLRQFWATNEWARKSFSKNMEYAWKKIKEENESFFTIRTVPIQINKFVEDKLKVPEGTFCTDTVYNPYTKQSHVDQFSQDIFKVHTNIEGLNDVLADAYQIAVFKIAAEIKDLDLKREPKEVQEFARLTLALMYKNFQGLESAYNAKSLAPKLGQALNDMQKSNMSQESASKTLAVMQEIVNASRNKKQPRYAVQTTDEARLDFVRLACAAAESKNPDLVKLVNWAMDSGFETSMQYHSDFRLK